MIPELRRWTREEMMKRVARWPWAPAFAPGHAHICPPPLRGRAQWGVARAAHQGGGAEHKICASPSAFAGTTKKRFDLKRSRFNRAVLSFAAILSLLATAATAADNLPPNSSECASPRAARPAPIVDGHRLQPRACAFAASPDVSKSDARVVDELYRELIGQSPTPPPSPPAKDRR
jgi:hypothetical protein